MLLPMQGEARMHRPHGATVISRWAAAALLAAAGATLTGCAHDEDWRPKGPCGSPPEVCDAAEQAAQIPDIVEVVPDYYVGWEQPDNVLWIVRLDFDADPHDAVLAAKEAKRQLERVDVEGYDNTNEIQFVADPAEQLPEEPAVFIDRPIDLANKIPQQYEDAHEQ